ncbi:MAG: alpha/beta fold hydrolase [Blautia sp.]|jgi:pimeloyl-ACP methyl ester carboxylesterase
MDIQLHYEERGEGMPMVLLHGNGEDHDYFRKQIEYFSKKYKVVAVDTRGHGKSPRGTAPFTLKQFAEDLKCFLDAHGWKKVILLGFSDGGNIALLFTLKYPEYVERLILNGANINPKGVRASIQIPIIMGYYMTKFFARFSEKARRNTEMLGLMVTQPNILPDRLEKITCPVLVIVGDKDMIALNHTKLIGWKIPNSRLKILKGDHFLADKEADSFNAAVEEFLSA